MEFWTGALSCWKCHWTNLKSAGLFLRNLFVNSLKNLNIVILTLWPINSGVLDSLLLPHLSSFLTDYLPSLNLWCHSKTDARFMQDGRKAVWSIPYVSVASFFPSLKQNFIAYCSSKIQIVFLKFTSCNNQALVGCIPIAAVTVHFNLKS